MNPQSGEGELIWEFFGRNAEGFFVEISGCPYCAGNQADHGICYFPIGFYSEALRWATGATYPVDEVECIAAGGQVCRFRIGRAPEAS